MLGFGPQRWVLSGSPVHQEQSRSLPRGRLIGTCRSACPQICDYFRNWPRIGRSQRLPCGNGERLRARDPALTSQKALLGTFCVFFNSIDEEHSWGLSSWRNSAIIRIYGVRDPGEVSHGAWDSSPPPLLLQILHHGFLVLSVAIAPAFISHIKIRPGR